MFDRSKTAMRIPKKFEDLLETLARCDKAYNKACWRVTAAREAADAIDQNEALTDLEREGAVGGIEAEIEIALLDFNEKQQNLVDAAQNIVLWCRAITTHVDLD